MQCASEMVSSLLWYTEDDNNSNKEPKIIEQFVQDVEDFSSQYGSEISISYTAFNIRGPPSNYPDYGDYPQAFVMRTYGTWWEEAPSAQQNYMVQNNNSVTSQDFVEVSFREAVYPLDVSVFETYNPGALVRIWARGVTSWYLLWEGEPQYVGDTPRIFCPPIKQIDEPTRVLRLEFNHKLLPYYTELDAVLLRGILCPDKDVTKKTNIFSLFGSETEPVFEKGQILNKVLASNLHETIVSPQPADSLKPKEIDTGPTLGDFQALPDETILYVMKYLDMQSLCRCAQINRHFNRLASDSVLYRNIDLRPYWYCVQSQVLTTLSTRCKFLQKLDLSWCGSRRMVQANYVVNFIKDCGAELTHLRMNCCKFVDNALLRTIVITSSSLQELCLRSVVGCGDWLVLASLKKLRRLDLYRTDIPTAAAVAMITANPGLEHLNVGSCKMISAMDEVAIALGNNCPELKSVDFWRSFSLTPNGIRALGNCRNLQELDVGWCFIKDCGAELTHLRMNCCKFVDNALLRTIVITSSSLQELCLRSVVGCGDWLVLASLKKLRRLDLYRTDIPTAAAVAMITANPGLEHLNVGSCKMISAMDEVAIALGNNCPELKSVDFWRSFSLTPNGIRALGNCRNLQELDVGWCLQAGASGEWLAWLSGNELRKLFLGALRGICDRDIRALLPRMQHLQQLDLLGVRAVTPDICDAILDECRELKLLDVSFCDQIQDYQVMEWREQYPHVRIKRSFQSSTINSIAPNPLFLAPILE